MSTKKANLILTTCSMAWGTSYIFMKLGIEGLSPLMLMALRTGIAFLILVLIFFKRLLKVNKRLLLYSAITGFLLFTNLTPILYGLNTITASQSGFILSTTAPSGNTDPVGIDKRILTGHIQNTPALVFGSESTHFPVNTFPPFTSTGSIRTPVLDTYHDITLVRHILLP